MLSLPIYVAIAVLAVVVVLGLVFAARYKTVGADKAMIVTGSFLGSRIVKTDEHGARVKIVRGGGSFILPIFQQANFLSLHSHTLEISTPEVYDSNGVPVMADSVTIIKIGGTIEDIATAAEQFMGKSDEELRGQAKEVLEGHLRSIVGSMAIKDLNRDKEKFAQEIQTVAAQDLQKMGLVIVSLTIRDLRDKNDYLKSLGLPEIAAVKRDAIIAQAEADKEARIRRARAEEEAQKAELLKETNIAEAEKEKELKVASFKQEQDRAKAEADQAYRLQEAVTRQKVTEEEMKVTLVQKEKEIELEEKEIQRREKQYDAEVKKKADADRYAVEQAAEADKIRLIREAEAHAEQKRVEGLAQAEAEKAKGIAQAEAEKAKGMAEAEVTRLKLEAEAEGKQKLAEAYEKFGQAAVLELVLKTMPELASKIAEPIRSIDKVTVIDNGNGQGDGINRFSNNVTKLMTQLPEMLKDTTGLDLNSMISTMIKPTTEPSIPVPAANEIMDKSMSEVAVANKETLEK
ncbi:SPFH domain-containing protein [Brevibacillus ginsengisoli]|uniref:flotillin family protein n=1 Tax=Brevibacillus ginsengisoli TaxID=363854 RepID=UPI003CFB9C2A